MNIKISAVLLILATLVGCQGGGSSTTFTDMCAETNSDTFSCEQVLVDTLEVVANEVEVANARVAQLELSITNYCTDLSQENLDDAKLEWANVMASVQVLEPMQLGPLAELRDDLYIWPGDNTCRAFNQVAINPSADLSGIDKSYRGLTAVEKMLFLDDSTLSCTGFPNVATWVEKSEAQKNQDRCDYARNIVSDMKVKFTTLSTTLDSYSLENEFSSLQLAANEISDALFYVDTVTKDLKLKEILPINDTGDFQKLKLESRYGQIAKQNILNNLLGAKALLTAGDNEGMDDYMAALGQSEITTGMVTAVNKAIVIIEGMQGEFHEAIPDSPTDSDVSTCINATASGEFDVNSDLERLCALYFEVQSFTSLLKEDFVLALKFTKPAEADGDND